MNEPEPPRTSRRDFLSGKSALKQVEHAGEVIGGYVDIENRPIPSASETTRLATKAMACEFSVITNPGEIETVWHSSSALDRIHELEAQLSVYRTDSEVSRLNQTAFQAPQPVEPNLFQLLRQSVSIWRETHGAFNPCGGPLIRHWRACRQEVRLPTEDELESVLAKCRPDHVVFDDEKTTTIRFETAETEFDLGGIGKGYALDRASELLHDHEIHDYIFQGGQSSVLAKGNHTGLDGWPIGIIHPNFPQQRLGTLMLRDRGFSASGSGIQYFRHAGKRYGHILDPRTGWPAEGMLFTAVLAPSAALADAFSTAFFVLGLEKTLEICDNSKDLQVIMIPALTRGRRLRVVSFGISEEEFFVESSDAVLERY